MLEIQQKIHVYEKDGVELPVGEAMNVFVFSHPIWNTLVVLKIGRHSWTVKARDMELAIENARNSGSS